MRLITGNDIDINQNERKYTVLIDIREHCFIVVIQLTITVKHSMIDNLLKECAAYI